MSDRIARATAVRLIALAAGSATLAIGAAGHPGRLSAQVIDRGTLAVLRGQDTVGLERFTVTATPRGFEITSTAFYPASRPAITIEGTLRIGLDSLPTVASIENIRGGTRRVMAQFDPRRMTFRRMSERGESAREFPGAARILVVFDSLLAFHAIPPGLAEGALTVVGPATDYRRTFRLADRGQETMSVAGVRVAARHLTLTADTDVRHLWYHEKRLQRVELPDLGIVAVRLPTGES